MTIGFGNIAEPDCSVSAEKVVHPLMREEGLILLSSLLSKERTSGNIARSPLLRLTFRHSCQKVPPAGGIGVRGMPPASGVLTSKCDACATKGPATKGPALRDLWRSLRHGRGFLLMESRPSLYSTYVLKKWVWPQFSNKHFYRL